jgi:hypothetical protein
LDKVANLVEKKAGHVDRKLVASFFGACDKLADSMEALSKQADFDASSIGEEVGGPLEQDSDESWMRGEFTQEEFIGVQSVTASRKKNANASVKSKFLLNLLFRADPKTERDIVGVLRGHGLTVKAQDQIIAVWLKHQKEREGWEKTRFSALRQYLEDIISEDEFEADLAYEDRQKGLKTSLR